MAKCRGRRRDAHSAADRSQKGGRRRVWRSVEEGKRQASRLVCRRCCAYFWEWAGRPYSRRQKPEGRSAVGGLSEMQFIFTNEEEYVIVATDIKKREKDGNHVAGPC